MRWAPDHALEYQGAANGAERLHRTANLTGDIAGAMWAGAQFGHGTEIFLFGGREAIEAHAKKAFIEGCHDFPRCVEDIVLGDRAGSGSIPGVFAPFLQEIRISAGLADDSIDCGPFDLRSFVGGGLHDGEFRIGLFQRADLVKSEETFRV